jgi:PAS domain S-box-containing protein
MLPVESTQPTFDAFAAAMDAVASGVAVLGNGASALVAYVNPALLLMTGRAAPQLLGQDPSWLVAPQTDPDVLSRFRAALSALESGSFELLIRRSDGSEFWSRVTLAPLRQSASGYSVLTCEDISAHKRARESLRTSEGRLEVAMEAGELSMWDWNIESGEISYNDQWRVSLGIDPQQLLQRKDDAERLLLPADAPQILEQFQRHYRGDSPHFAAEYQLPTNTGAPRWFMAHAKVVRRDAGGRPVRMVGVMRDIARRRQRMQEAEEVQQQWERAVRGTSDGLYDWDLLTGRVWYADRFRELIGFEARDFPATFQAFQRVLHADDRQLVLAKIRSHLEGRSMLDVRCRVATGHGTLVWCRLRGKAERDASGRPVRLSGSISDITAQVQAEEALNRSQDFYGTLLDSMPLFIAHLDRDERVVYVNRPFQKFFDVPLSSSRGRKVEDIIGPKRYSAMAPHVREALNGKVVDGQGRLRDAEGSIVDLDATFVPHTDELGDIQGCFIVARDITERRLLEAELRQSQKMEAVGRLTGGIAHDFNNLLSVIVGNMQLLSRSLRDSPRLLRQADTALKAAVRGGELTRRLLTFARQQVLAPTVVELNELISGMYELLRRTLTDEIEIQLALDPTLWPTKIDPGQLENAVLNLVINARDAMPAGGAIAVATRNVTLDAQRAPGEEPLVSGDYALVEVKDSGSGMSDETLKRVFEPFFTTKEVGKGSGLGLSMVYGFVKQSGGHVSIASALGRGTQVRLYFPRAQAAAEQATVQNGAPSEMPRGSEAILVVEDDLEVRATAVDILTSLGYRVHEASNGHQAVEKFMQHPDVVLVFSDIMLPGGLLGTNLVQKLRERRPALKVLMTSGFSESSILHRGILDGTMELLGKPYNVEDLARRIRAILDEKEEMHRVPA